MSGPINLEIKEGALAEAILRRCHRDGVDPNKATSILWRRQLKRDGSIVGEDEEPTGGEEPTEENDTEEREP